jgi:drug/metabolite transporter (DMT)-like permease
MLAVALALSSSFCGGCADFIAGLQNRRHRLVTVMFVSQCMALVIAVVAVWATGTTLGGTRETLLAAAGGVSIGIALACLYRGLAVGTMAIVAPISACGAIVPVVVSLARGDNPGLLPQAGIALAFVGIVAATRHQDIGDAPASRPRGTHLAFGAALGFGGFYLAVDAAAAAEPLATVLVARVSLLVLLVGTAVLTRARLAVPRDDLGPLLAVGVLDFGAVATYTLATQEGVLSVVSVLASFPPLVTLVLARVVLREHISRMQSLGVGATLFGITLIAIG